MDCKRVNQMIFLFFDDEMEEGDRPTFEEHLDRCPRCAQQLDYTRKLLLLFRRRCVRCEAPPRLHRRILISLPHRRTVDRGN